MSDGPSDPASWQPMGPNFYRIAGDTLFVRNQGDATLESTMMFTDLCRKLIAQNGYVLGIADLTVSGMAPPEARRHQAKAIKSYPAGSYELAVYGMSRLIGTFVQLTVRATALLTSRDGSVTIVSDEAAALHWRDERRRVMQARFGPKPNA